ncbi:MAG: phage tail protein [Haloarculaceae archaeon]
MADRHGPLRTGRFKVELDDVEVSGFKRIDIPGQSTKLVEYREGKDADHHRKLWGQTEYEDLTMERGAKQGDTKLFDWRKKVRQGKMEEARKNIAIVLQDEVGESQVRWEFTKAWPKRYDPPTLDTSAQGGQGTVATETVVVVFDEFERVQ